MGVSRDITERVNYENELRKLSSAVEQSPVSILISNLSGDIEYVNPTFTKVTGYTFDEVKGKNPRILSSGETPSEGYKKLWETIISGKTWQGEFHNKKKNGELFWEFASISPIKDVKGMTTNFIAIKEDITERKIAQMELIAAKEKAEEMNSLKTKFLANMSHELRTPLIGVLGYAEILKNDLKIAEQQAMAGTIHDSGKRLLHTLNLLLDLTRIESDKEDIYIRKIDVGEITIRAVKLFDINAANKNLLLTTSIIKNIKANLDERIFVQIINNLVNNAIKFTDKGKITVEIDSENDDVVLRVRDTGIGIPEEKQEIIFEEFRQVSEGLNRRHQGTGLGLTITKKYIDILNGTISVNSKINHGSVFTVKIPSGNLN
jgi:PAS domain S-box-containing protein